MTDVFFDKFNNHNLTFKAIINNNEIRHLWNLEDL